MSDAKKVKGNKNCELGIFERKNCFSKKKERKKNIYEKKHK